MLESCSTGELSELESCITDEIAVLESCSTGELTEIEQALQNRSGSGPSCFSRTNFELLPLGL